MTVTLFGVLVALIGGYLLLRASTLAMLIFVMFTTLLAGSAAVNLSTGSSIQPSIEAVLLLALRCVMPSHRPAGTLRAALDGNLPLLLFTVYAVAGIAILPFVFAGAIDVAPLRPVATPDAFATVPLGFSPQNLTTAGYMFATMLGAVGAFVAVQARGAELRIARAGAAIAIIHASIGFAGIAAAGTPLAAAFSFFRNAQYNQLDQDVGGLARMNGIFAEASNFAVYGFIYLVFVTELWLRDVERRRTGPAALLLLAALIMATSTTGYVGLAAYALVLGLRQIVFPATIASSKIVAIAIGSLVATVAVVATFVMRPETFKVVDLVYRMMIVGKTESESGQIRLMWARQGIAAFWASGGLGVGVGSFRSSSLGTAILGSMGVFGIATFVAQLLRVLQPLRQSTYVRSHDPRMDVGVAAAWTAALLALVSSIAAPSPDPGINWGLMVGIALGLRTRREIRAA